MVPGSRGNQTAGLGRTVSYSSFNKPVEITQGGTALYFSHDTDHQRFKQVSPDGVTLYFEAFGVRAELFQGASNRWNEYLMVGSKLIGLRVLLPDETDTFRYFHKDHLGSVAVITDGGGAVVERISYDAWGKRRFANGADDPSGSIASQTTRGYTGHEHLDAVGLIHMNGRVYDPLIGRMTSADPFVPDAMNGQAWNRYSYVVNNPLQFTDPDGYCFLGLCGIGKAISRVFHGVQKAFRSISILGDIIKIGVTAICAATPGCQAFLPIIAAAASAVVAGVTSGDLGVALKAGAIAFASAAAFNVVGGLTGHQPAFLTPDHFANIAGHSAIGCGMSVASGGRCGPGALAGAITSFAGPVINGKTFDVGSLVANAALGGAASIAGGGKFGNGAATGAFGYLFNFCAGGRCYNNGTKALGALTHFFGGGGESAWMNLSEIDTTSFDLTKSAEFMRRVGQGYNGILNLSVPFATSGEEAAYIGRIIIDVRGVLATSPSGGWSFTGDYSARKDMILTHRQGELLPAKLPRGWAAKSLGELTISTFME